MTAPVLDVSRETMHRLEAFEALLIKWNAHINLISRASLEDLWHRHILDSVQAYQVAPTGMTWADLGSGGGFPGLVVAILAAEQQPDMSVTLIESDQRKSEFLRAAAREVGIACKVLPERVEAADPQGADIVSARALGDLSVLLGYAERHLAKDGTALFLKGVTWQKELDTARLEWRFDFDVIESRTMPGAAILKLKGVSRV